MAEYPNLDHFVDFCACAHLKALHLDGTGDCAGGRLHDPCRCSRYNEAGYHAPKYLEAEIQRLNENKLRLAEAYHVLDARCDRYRAALEEISRRLCKFPVGDKCEEPDCRTEMFEGDLSDLCSTCVARIALEEKP